MQKEIASTTRILREPSREVDLLAHTVIGAALDVHRTLGPGYLEEVYQQALELELTLRGVPFQRQAPAGVVYKNVSIGTFRIDLVIDDRLLVELKAVESIAPVHIAQVVSYLKATAHELGLILNFNVPVLREGIRRVLPRPR
jgi:GxxExxY protein